MGNTSRGGVRQVKHSDGKREGRMLVLFAKSPGSQERVEERWREPGEEWREGGDEGSRGMKRRRNRKDSVWEGRKGERNGEEVQSGSRKKERRYSHYFGRWERRGIRMKR